jgi:hypothetical protein
VPLSAEAWGALAEDTAAEAAATAAAKDAIAAIAGAGASARNFMGDSEGADSAFRFDGVS